MCRIAGIISPSLSIPQMEHTVKAMCNVQRHGGPDDEGVYTDPHHGLVFGHRRLSLLDLAPTGHQPMHYHERYTITFNGEIYNYRELKTELLALGHRFVSTTDTEVILAAFAAWGTASFARLDGMFAFALFDRQTGDLCLVRDFLGIKPLYYLLQNDTLVFASEVRAFYQLPQVPAEHPHWPVFLMAYGHLPEPVTTLKGVQPLRKGSFLRFNTRNGVQETEVFEHLSYLEKPASRQEAIRMVQEVLQTAVRRHLLCDARLGVFLSGGVDSSIISLLAAQERGQGLNTLSIHFSEEAYSEKQYQDQVQQRLSSVHHQHLLNKEAFHFHLPEIIEAMDLPSSDGINTWFISGFARQAGLKAVLSGLGGDELFGGYPSFRRTAMAAALQNIPASALRAGRFSRVKKYRRLAYLGLPGAKGQYLFLRGLFIPPAIARYLNIDEAEVWKILESAPAVPDLHHLSHGNRASWMELHLYLQNQLLRDADVMSMAHGVEIRVPFLDKEFVRLALSLESGVKYTGSHGKQLLIDAFRPVLPAGVWQRKKMGFSFPFAAWLRQDEWMRSKLSGGGRSGRSALRAFDEGRLHWSGLLTLILLRAHHHETQTSFSYA